MNNKKICFFMEQYGLGGTDVQLVNLINNWPEKKDEIYYITNEGNKGLMLFNSLLKREIKIIPIKLRSFAYYWQNLPKTNLPKLFSRVLNIMLLLSKYLFFLIDIIRLSLVFCVYSFDVFISDNGGYPGSDSCRAAVFASLICGIPRRYALIHHEAQSIEKIAYPIEYVIDRLMQKSVNAIIAVSAATKNTLLRRGFSGHNIKVIYNGIEEDMPGSNKLDIREKFGIDRNKLIIGMMGNIEPSKGHSVLLEAVPKICANYADIHFVFIGSLYDENWKRDHADRILAIIEGRKMQNCVTLTGFLEGKPIDFIGQFDVLVMPTLDFEGFGLVLAEAMIMRKPIVASTVGAIPEVIIHNESGILVIPGDPNKLADGILFLLKNEIKAKEMTENARKRYENNFTAKIMARKYYDLVKGKK